MNRAVVRASSLAIVVCVALSGAACDDSVEYDPDPMTSAGTGTDGDPTPGTAPETGTETAPETAPETGTETGTETAAVLELVTPMEALGILEDPPAGLVVLDVRTLAEFDRGHLEGAIQIDYYGATFATELDALDKSVPYLLYCQSGGRSASTLGMMDTLGFEEVYEIEGGFSAWTAAGLPVAE